MTKSHYKGNVGLQVIHDNTVREGGISCPLLTDGGLPFHRRMNDYKNWPSSVEMVDIFCLPCSKLWINHTGTSCFSHNDIHLFRSSLNWTHSLQSTAKIVSWTGRSLHKLVSRLRDLGIPQIGCSKALLPGKNTELFLASSQLQLTANTFERPPKALK